MDDTAALTDDAPRHGELAELYREYQGFIRGALRKHYVGPEELDDVTQEVFVVLLRKLDEQTQPQSIRAWLYQIARRVAANHHRADRRRRRKRDSLATQPPMEEGTVVEETVVRAEARAALAEFMQGLDEEACAVFVMSEVEGLRGADIAARLGISLPMTYARIRTVRARFHRKFGTQRHAAWAGLAAVLERTVAAALTVAFAIGTRTRLAIGAAIAIALLIALYGVGGGGSGGSDGAPPSGVGGGPVPAAGDSKPTAAPRGPIAASTLEALVGAALDAGTARFGGVVVDPDGKGIAGAVVCGDRVRVPDHMLTTAPRCVKTDAAGRFTVAGMLDEAHTVSAMARGFSPGTFHGRPRSDIRIVLHPGGAELSGVVLDVYGGPIADAWVTLEHVAEETLGATARTNDDGRFSMWVAEGRIQLAAGAEGYAPAYSLVLSPSTDVRLELGAESIISGTVVDARGKAMADVRVSALLVPGPERFANRGANTFSDAQGRWEIRGLQPHEYILDAAGARSWGRAAEPVDLGVGDRRTGIRIEMIDGADLVGRIVDADTGEPCAEGFVTTLDKKQSITREGRTDHEGWVVLPSLSGDARYRITVACRGYESSEVSVDVGTQRGESHEWSLTKGRTLVIAVRTPGGTPLPDWQVRILMPDSHRRVFDHRSTWQPTNAEGRVEFTGLPAGTYEIRADGPGGGPLGAEQAVVEAPRTEVELTARAGVAVTGRVVDQRAQALRGAVVSLQGPKPEFSKIFGPTLEQRQSSFASGPYRAVTSVDGRFRLATVPPGDYEVWVVPEASATSVMVPGVFDNPFEPGPVEPLRTITVDEAPVDVELQVEVSDGIAGVVRDEEEDLIAGARVFAIPEHEGRLVAPRGRPQLSDEEGRYAFEGLLPGDYTVVAYRSGGGVVRRPGVVAGTMDADLVFPRLGTISGRVLDAQGEPVTGYQLYVRRDDEARERFVPVGSAKGAFRASGLAEGTYHIRVHAEEDAATASVEVELGAGEDREGVELTLEPRTIVAGRLLDDAGQPRAGWKVALIVAGGARTPDNVRVVSLTEADGAFELYDMGSGPLALIAGTETTPEAFAAAVVLATVEPEEGERTEIGDVVAK